MVGVGGIAGIVAQQTMKHFYRSVKGRYSGRKIFARNRLRVGSSKSRTIRRRKKRRPRWNRAKGRKTKGLRRWKKSGNIRSCWLHRTFTNRGEKITFDASNTSGTSTQGFAGGFFRVDALWFQSWLPQPGDDFQKMLYWNMYNKHRLQKIVVKMYDCQLKRRIIHVDKPADTTIGPIKSTQAEPVLNHGTFVIRQTQDYYQNSVTNDTTFIKTLGVNEMKYKPRNFDTKMKHVLYSKTFNPKTTLPYCDVYANMYDDFSKGTAVETTPTWYDKYVQASQKYGWNQATTPFQNAVGFRDIVGTTAVPYPVARTYKEWWVLQAPFPSSFYDPPNGKDSVVEFYMSYNIRVSTKWLHTEKNTVYSGV